MKNYGSLFFFFFFLSQKEDIWLLTAISFDNDMELEIMQVLALY